jgi:hypothetical protein
MAHPDRAAGVVSRSPRRAHVRRRDVLRRRLDVRALVVEEEIGAEGWKAPLSGHRETAPRRCGCSGAQRRITRSCAGAPRAGVRVRCGSGSGPLDSPRIDAARQASWRPRAADRADSDSLGERVQSAGLIDRSASSEDDRVCRGDAQLVGLVLVRWEDRRGTQPSSRALHVLRIRRQEQCANAGTQREVGSPFVNAARLMASP